MGVCHELGLVIYCVLMLKFLEDAGLHETEEEAFKRTQVLARIREVSLFTLLYDPFSLILYVLKGSIMIRCIWKFYMFGIHMELI